MSNKRKIRVMFGLCNPDHTWEEVELRFDIDAEWEEKQHGFVNLHAEAFCEWLSSQKEKVATVLSGSFVISWDWVDEIEEKEG